VVEIDEFVALLYLCSFRNNVDIIVYYDEPPFWISVDTDKDDLE